MKAFKSWLQVLQLILFIFLTNAVSAQLKADFSGSTTTGCPPLIVNFRDMSTGNPTSWRWDLGNGTQSFVANPLGTYFDPGTYTVKLVIRNSNNDADSIIKTQYIVVHALPTPAFNASDTAGCFPLRVQFNQNSIAGSGTISSYQWDFGDGNLSNQPNPVHTYTNPGSFTVNLRIVNSNGCSRVLTRPNYIVTTDGVKADFTYSSAQSCRPPTPITFTNTSSGAGLSYQWNFGDGNTSTQRDPVHTYTAAGVYTVRLIVSTLTGCTDTIVKTNAINIGTVNASFNGPDSVCFEAPATFTNTSTPSSVGANWYFSDGSTATGNNVVKVFSSPGLYQVKLVNDFGACTDSITKSIRVLAKPTAGFTASNSVTCSVPLTVNFTNTSTGANSYSWSFGDGGLSNSLNPSHTYGQPADYTVSLIVRNSVGCTDTMTIPDLVKINPPRITSINNLNVRGCTPLVVHPSASVQSNQPITSYFWDFGDGTTSSVEAPTHTYTTAGVYSVKLVIQTASGCKDSMTVNSAVIVGNKPTAAFTATPRDACAFVPVQFTDQSTGANIHEWYWDFGDGGSSIEQNPDHIYGDTGYFNITLVVFNYGCSDTLFVRDYIHIKPPIARFDTAFTCTDRLTRRFIDESIDAQTWQWDFGDGNTSTQQNPVHTYATGGTYKVKLKVTNGTCEHENERDVVVVKESGTIKLSDSIGCRNTRIAFNVENVNPSNIQLYSFYLEGLNPNPVNSPYSNASQFFNTAGVFNSAIAITDILGCRDTIYTAVPITIFGPKADFTATPVGACSNTTITFTDSTLTDGTHPIVSWDWNYGEGGTQTYTAGPFSYTYTQNGSYDVKLLVQDSYGCKDSIVKRSFVNISKPVAGFTVSDTIICPSSNVSFTNTSTGGFDVRYTWTFGDGNTTPDPNPTHAYATQGTYQVKMVMTDRYGCTDSTERTIHAYNPTAGFALSDSFSSCPPLLVDFTNQSSNYVQINWDFGDGSNSQLVNPSRMYTYPGIYNIKLTVVNNGGCIDTLSKTITIQGPTGSFTYNPLKICTAGEVSFVANAQNTVNYIWDYNDGNLDFGTQSTTSHVYTNTGNYLPKLILEDASGCRVPIIGTDTISVLGVNTFILAQPRVLCDSGMVAFSDSTISNDQVVGYSWNFGDGTTGTGSNPSHNYTASGLYNVSLITTTAFGCADTAVYNSYIKIVSSPTIRISGDTAACEPALLTFSGVDVVPDTSALAWNWTFGNGNTASVQNPTGQSYPVAGSYPVTATATNSDGCATTVSTTALVHPKPVIDLGPDTTICKFTSYTINATGANQYTWTANPTLSCTNCASPSATPLFKETYYVVGTSSFGCTSSDSIVINVQQPFTITVSNSDTLCVGETRQLRATGADNYNWTPARWLNDPTSASPISQPDSTITYKVVGTDDYNCFRDSGYVTLTVFPIPRIEILNGEAITMMVGSTVKLNTRSSPDVTNWRWMTSQYLSCSTCPEPETTPKQNITYSVFASNDGRCIARDQITITLICDNANVYIPNTFSPNGDGMNDVFYPRGTGLYTMKTMRIFNRWGQLLFEKNNVTPNNSSLGWDGTFNGVKLQSDVYVYVMEAMCENNQVVPIKGNVTLIR